MIVKINGGSADLHMISLTDMKKLSESIQKISYNYEYEKYGTRNKTIYIKANREGSFETLLGLIDPTHVSAILDGVEGAFLYDLIKKMKEYLTSDITKVRIKQLVEETFDLALELAESEYYDTRFDKKKQKIEKNTKLVNAELANYQAMKQIVSIMGESSNEHSLKPTSIQLVSTINDDVEELDINLQTREILEKNEIKAIKINNIIIKGIPDNLSRANKSFYMEMDFVGKIKIRATDKQLSTVSDYFKENKSLKIEIEPIIRMGSLTGTREAKLKIIIED
jgi:hypothetical protein